MINGFFNQQNKEKKNMPNHLLLNIFLYIVAVSAILFVLAGILGEMLYPTGTITFKYKKLGKRERKAMEAKRKQDLKNLCLKRAKENLKTLRTSPYIKDCSNLPYLIQRDAAMGGFTLDDLDTDVEELYRLEHEKDGLDPENEKLLHDPKYWEWLAKVVEQDTMGDKPAWCYR